MNWKQILSIKGTNPWLMFACLGWNLLWTFFIMTAAFLLLSRGQNQRNIIQIGLLAGAFIGPFLGGWVIGRMASDNRGATYGVIGSLISVVINLIAFVPGGPLGLMTAIAALAGGLNGGLLSQDRRLR